MNMDVVDRLLALRVADVMTKDLVTVSAHQNMTRVADMFVEHEISFAPIVDEQGKCVGVVSSGDFVTMDRSATVAEHIPLGMDPHRLEQTNEDAPLQITPVQEEMASSHMTTAVQTVREGVSLVAASRIMCAEHIHHLPVVDDEQRLTGVISVMDVVAALVNVVDEMTSGCHRT